MTTGSASSGARLRTHRAAFYTAYRFTPLLYKSSLTSPSIADLPQTAAPSQTPSEHRDCPPKGLPSAPLSFFITLLVASNALNLGCCCASLAEQSSSCAGTSSSWEGWTFLGTVMARCAMKVRAALQKEITKLRWFFFFFLPIYFSVCDRGRRRSVLQLLQLTDGIRWWSQTLRACLS